MPSQYSPDLRIELIGTGDQAGVWGATTNNNLAYVLEQAIAGYVSVPVTSTAQVLTYVSGASSTAADNQSVHASLALTASGVAADFFLYAPPSSKLYVIYNNTGYTAKIRNSTVIGNTTAAGTGVDIPTGKVMTVWSDGTNFVQQNTHLIAPTIAGGTITSPTFVTPALGTPASGVMTNVTGTASGLSIGGNAATATNATYATSAGSATNATSATYATSAGSATNATSAGSATNATYAASAGAVAWGNVSSKPSLVYNDSGTYSINIYGGAASATNASSATYAGSAGSATNATYASSAGSAGSATNATYAAGAGYATNAGYATSAGTTGANSFNTVGSYAYASSNGPAVFTPGTNYAAGTGANQLFVRLNAGSTNAISGTWGWRSNYSNLPDSESGTSGLVVRVA
jgi:hypothetical protein